MHLFRKVITVISTIALLMTALYQGVGSPLGGRKEEGNDVISSNERHFLGLALYLRSCLTADIS